MIVMKFGGTSVADFAAISRTINIIKSRLDNRPAVVVSALSKVTDLLYRISDRAADKDVEGAKDLLSQLRQRHLALAEELLREQSPDLYSVAIDKLSQLCNSLDAFVYAVCSLGELSDRSKARIISTGEYLSSTIIWCALNASGVKTAFVDARNMMISSDDYLKGEPLMGEISNLVPQVLLSAMEGMDAAITQGFVTATSSGDPAVLGRGGSDYSASLIGMASNADRIEIWTDVDGVRTADPRIVSDTQSITRISFEEAAEMAHFGAKVLHPLTIEPAVMKNIPIYVLNSMNPNSPGTAILQSKYIDDGVKSVSFKENIILMNIFSVRMINTSGFLRRVFDIFAENKVSIDLISTSEASISLTMEPVRNLEKVVRELSAFSKVEIETSKAQISVIGKNIVNLGSVLRRTMDSMRDKNVYMISQGATYVNISFVVDSANMIEVVREVHKFLFENKDSVADQNK